MRREFLGISQGRLGRHLGLTFSQVQKYEKGTNRIGAGRLYLLARFLGVSVQYFYEGLDEVAVAKNGMGRPGERDSDVNTLDDAFLSIHDPDTRRSVLALVCSLASAREPVGAERRA
jgi:transcriptional regulator with XRE-family HTH domain